MKFNEFKYEHPDLDNYKMSVEKVLKSIGTDKSFDEELAAINKMFALTDELDTLYNLVSVRYSIDTRDAFYEKEMAFFDENLPALGEYDNLFNQRLLNSKNRTQLEQKLGSLIFKQAELSLKTFSPEIIPDLQEENKLSTEYSKLLASARIEFQGKTYNLSQIGPFKQDTNREVRKAAALATSNWMEENELEIDRIYDSLVQVRTKIAHKLGYENFVQLGYDRLGRTDYDHKNVKNYRDQIYSSLVPLVTELTSRKAKRIQIEEPKAYDLALSFLSGNPTPKGDMNELIQKAKEMYEEMSPETGEFWNFMVDNGLLDLDAKEGKMGGGYCTFIPEYSSPFIFSNFNGTAGDVDVLTHEAGHAFQVYSSKDNIPSYRWPTLEAAEIHSMSMEFLAWPWMNSFFQEDTDKYKFSHLAGALTFLPYGVAVDEFQHGVYENPELTPDDRKTLWRKIEKKYLPFKDYGEDSFLEKGTFWFRQSHIFSSPFYYIDYTLAQVVAFQYWIKSKESHKAALEEYKHLCSLGGSQSFVSLLNSAKLDNPFENGVVEKTIQPIKEYLASINDIEL